jgi:hypothetical protein
MFENGVLRKIPVPKKGEVIGGFRKLHNEELHDLCPSPNITVKNQRELKWSLQE